MIKINVDEKGNQKRIVSYLQTKFNKLPQNAIYKALRNKDIKINGNRIKENVTLKHQFDYYVKLQICNLLLGYLRNQKTHYLVFL